MRRIILVVCAVALLAGCATLQRRGALLDQTVEAYGAALRWGDFEGARAYVDPAVRAAHPLTPQRKAQYDSVRVAEYEAAGQHATGPDTIEQAAQISLIVKSSQAVYTIVDHQTWRWDSSAHRWWLETGLPDITPK